MKRAFALILALILCLSLCACDEGGDSGSAQKETKPGTDDGLGGFVDDVLGGNDDASNLYDHTLEHKLLSNLYGDWYLEGNLSWIVMPTKITFDEDGICFAEFPDHATEKTKTLYWGIVPDCTAYASKLYARIGTADDVWYLFELGFNSSGDIRADIAEHSADPVEMVAVKGLSQDGISGMWFTMMNEEPLWHPPVEEICGRWTTTDAAAPFQTLELSEDGTCVVDGVDAQWQIEESYTKESSLSILVLVDDTVLCGMVYFNNTKVATLTEQIGDMVSYLPFEAYKE